MYTDMFPVLGNFIETKLVQGCVESDTKLYIADVSKLPNVLTGKDYIPCVLRGSGVEREIVYVTAFSAADNSVTVQRGKEGTTAASWSAGTYMYNTVTAASFQRMRVNGFAPMVDPDGGRPAITRTSTGAISITGDFTSQLEVGMAVRVLSGDAVVSPADASLGAIFVSSVSFSGGKTSVGLQNVTLPSTVGGLDLGLSTASAPLYHPDTPLGDGETITMEGGMLKITEHFKQAQAAKDAEQDAAIASSLTSATIDGGDLVLTYGDGSTKRVQLPAGKSVGDLWMGFDSKSKPANVQLYAGQLLSRASYEAHSAFVLGGNRTVLSESDWQAQVSANGFCPFYSSGDGSTTYRMPLIKGVHPQFVAALAEAGQYIKAGLPNITGTASARDSDISDVVSGAFYQGASKYGLAFSRWDTSGSECFDASRSNPIYGKSDTVQPPSVTCVLGEYVVGSVAVLGEANAESLLTSVTQLESSVGALQNGVGRTSAYVIETWSSGTSGYRLWSDNWIEQWGILTTSVSENTVKTFTVTYPKAFANTNYTLYCAATLRDNAATDHQESMNEFSTKTTTKFTKVLSYYSPKTWWEAKGYVAV